MRKYRLLTSCCLLSMGLALSACGLFDKDNTPPPAALTNFQAEASPRLLWSARTSAAAGREFLKMSPAIGCDSIFTAGNNGVITATYKANGQRHWQTLTHYQYSTGPGVGDGLVVVGGMHGEVVALDEHSGKEIWATGVQGQVLAAPAISHGIVIIKTIDGTVHALDARTGQERWSFQKTEPNLILRGASRPVIVDNRVIVGFANGDLVKANLDSGDIIWRHAVATPEGAFAIQRMIDIDADPIIYDHQLFAATYQGKIAALDWNSGNIIWSHSLSSYSGMAAEHDNVYVSDAQGTVWSLGADTGFVNWRQTSLHGRGVTGPAIMENTLVVGDQQGYLHWLDKRDGHFVARRKMGDAIFAAPVVENNVLYAVNNQGHLVAYFLYR